MRITLLASLAAVALAASASAQCVGDLDGNGRANGADIGLLLGEWGAAGGRTGADIGTRFPR